MLVSRIPRYAFRESWKTPCAICVNFGIGTQALGVQASEDGGITVTSKKTDNAHQPGPNATTTTFGPNTSNRK